MSTPEQDDRSETPRSDGPNICLISRRNLYRSTRVVRQAHALTRAGYGVTVYCLGSPHEDLRSEVPEARFVEVGEAELARVSGREVQAIRREAGLETLPYVPWPVLRFLSGVKKSRVTGVLGQGVRSALLVARSLKPPRQGRPGVASGPTPERQATAELDSVAPIDLPRLQLSLAYRLHEHARFAAVVAAHIARQSRGTVDAVQMHDTHSLFAGRLIGRRLGIPVVYDAVEIPGHQIRSDRLPDWTDAAEAIMRLASRPAVEDADRVITVGASLAQWYDANFDLRAPVRPVMNARFHVPLSADTRLRRDCGVSEDTPLLFWCGSASSQRGLEFIAELLVHAPNAHAALVTEFPPFWEDFRKSFLALVDRLGVRDRLHILPLRPPQDLIGYASGADVGIITAPPGAPLNVRFSLPNKFFEMVMARLPIAVGDLDNIRLLVEQYGNGCYVDVTDVPAASRTIMALIARRRHDPALAESLEAAARALSWEEEAKTLVSVYDELLGKSRLRGQGGHNGEANQDALREAESLP